MELSHHQIRANPWLFSQSPFCDRYQPGFEAGISTAASAGCCTAGSKTGASPAQELARQHPEAGLGSLNCADTALQSTGSALPKITGKNYNLEDISSSSEDFLGFFKQMNLVS